MVKTMEWQQNALEILDQTKLPVEISFIKCGTYSRVGEAIKKLEVRGAPAIGAAAGFAMVLGWQQLMAENRCNLPAYEEIKNELIAARPTAVNLAWAAKKLYAEAERLTGQSKTQSEIACALEKLAQQIYMVYADKTRPLLQGARLTVWELMEDKIPVTVITDNMAAWTMQQKGIKAVVTGADRIALNGDTANKIGTFGVALAAKYHGIPFYIAAPVSTFDFSIADGSGIPIEERSAQEVKTLQGVVTAPPEALAYNPAFDVTPAALISGIITEYGVIKPPYRENIKKLQLKIKEEIFNE